ncbi:MAG: cysteine hydrolase [Clostridiaceae bacterium]|nr:cysteine hydrolase [Clostridiaceae bacterium]
MNNYLIIVDMQNDFISGSLGTKEALAIVPNVVRKIRDFDGSCIVTQDTHSNDYLNTLEGKNLPVKHCIEKTEGWELRSEVREVLASKGDVHKFKKPTFGSVELGNWLLKEHHKEPIKEITLIGLCTDICVISNALLIKAFLPEVSIFIDASCCAGVTPEQHQTALAAMKPCQIEIQNEN